MTSTVRVAAGRPSEAAPAGFTATDLLLLCMALIWGVNFAVVKFGAAQVPPLVFNSARVVLASVVMMVVYGLVIWLDSSSLTAGAAGTAAPDRRGSQLAVHSSLGYAGGFVGPLMIGFILDASGGMSRVSWGLSFLAVAVLMALALALFLVVRPRALAGDRAR